ncbi:MAG: response regulator [Candidatus Melainabacteria bacterium]|nr:response regulator [Candidatus Melainabacteria bacterium]
MINSRSESEAIDVLLVEDDRLLNIVIKLQLESESWSVRTTFDGLSALQMIREVLPTILVMDVNLPRMDAYELVAELRKSSTTAKLPLIIHTSMDLTNAEKALLELGATSFVTKTTACDGLGDTVRSLLAVEVV